MEQLFDVHPFERVPAVFHFVIMPEDVLIFLATGLGLVSLIVHIS